MLEDNNPNQNEQNIQNKAPQGDSKSKSVGFLDKIKAKLAGLGAIFEKIKGNSSSVFATTGEKVANLHLREKFENKTIRYSVIGGVAFVVILIIVLVIAFGGEKPLEVIYQQAPNADPIVRSDFTKKPVIKSSELQNLIQKASILYNNGQITEALDIYHNLSLFSQSFSNFNLGVAKLREKDYKEALASFDKTIDSGENVAVSAINAAIASYDMGDSKRYDYYTALARGSMIEWFNMPLYSYLYSLTNYYSGNYFHILSSLKNPSSEYYATEGSLLLAKMYLMFNDDYNALQEILKYTSIEDRYTAALIYARMGEYDLAMNELESYLQDTPNPSDEVKFSRALIEIKRSNFLQVSNIFEDLLKSKTNAQINEIYPIKIKLKDALFNIDDIQKNFWKRTKMQDGILGYKMLFYFAPFRVFDIDEAIDLIHEGGLHLKMNNIQEVGNVLLRGETISRVNKNITMGLKEIINHNTNKALKIMKHSVELHPNHQVLQYNLGLLYAQIDDFENARKHFLKAYHLDSNDILSGIFALVCMQLTNQDSTRLVGEITLDLDRAEFKNEIEEGFLYSLFGFVNGNISDDMLWFKSDNKDIMAYVLRALYAINSRDKATITNSFEDLRKISNNDMVANIMSRVARHYNDNIKYFSLDLLKFFKNDLKDLDLVYTGPGLAKQIYIYLAYLVGANHYVDEILTNKMLNTKGDISGILQALALNSIYMLDFEKAFTYYNTLIDDYKITSSENYFLAAVAAIGAGHYDNAVALIQLSKMESGFNLEARYALALLYQSIGNFNAASIHFAQMGEVQFVSEYFDFEIDTSKILQEN